MQRAVIAGLGAAAVFGAAETRALPGHPARICGFGADVTRSLDPGHRATAVRQFSEAMGSMPWDLGCTGGVVVLTFWDAGAFSSRIWRRLPVAPADQDCSKAPVSVSRKDSILIHLRSFRNTFQEWATTACQGDHEKSRIRFMAERQEFLAAVRRVLEAPQLDGITNSDICGTIEGLIASKASVIVLLTDGLDTLRPPSACRIPRGVRVTLILVPAAEEHGGLAATQLAAQQWKGAGAQVIPYTALAVPGVLAEAGNGRNQ